MEQEAWQQMEFPGGPEVTVRWKLQSPSSVRVQLFLNQVDEFNKMIDSVLDVSRTSLPFSLDDETGNVFCGGSFELGFVEILASPPQPGELTLLLSDFFYPGAGPAIYVLYPPLASPP